MALLLARQPNNPLNALVPIFQAANTMNFQRQQEGRIEAHQAAQLAETIRANKTREQEMRDTGRRQDASAIFDRGLQLGEILLRNRKAKQEEALRQQKREEGLEDFETKQDILNKSKNKEEVFSKDITIITPGPNGENVQRKVTIFGSSKKDLANKVAQAQGQELPFPDIVPPEPIEDSNALLDDTINSLNDVVGSAIPKQPVIHQGIEFIPGEQYLDSAGNPFIFDLNENGQAVKKPVSQ